MTSISKPGNLLEDNEHISENQKKKIRIQERREEGRSRDPVVGDHWHFYLDIPCHLKHSAELTPRILSPLLIDQLSGVGPSLSITNVWLDQACVSYYRCEMPVNNNHQETLGKQKFITHKSWKAHGIPGPHSEVFGGEREREKEIARKRECTGLGFWFYSHQGWKTRVSLTHSLLVKIKIKSGEFKAWEEKNKWPRWIVPEISRDL